jgi:hypothetical protein
MPQAQANVQGPSAGQCRRPEVKCQLSEIHFRHVLLGVEVAAGQNALSVELVEARPEGSLTKLHINNNFQHRDDQKYCDWHLTRMMSVFVRRIAAGKMDDAQEMV